IETRLDHLTQPPDAVSLALRRAGRHDGGPTLVEEAEPMLALVSLATGQCSPIRGRKIGRSSLSLLIEFAHVFMRPRRHPSKRTERRWESADAPRGPDRVAATALAHAGRVP